MYFTAPLKLNGKLTALLNSKAISLESKVTSFEPWICCGFLLLLFFPSSSSQALLFYFSVSVSDGQMRSQMWPIPTLVAWISRSRRCVRPWSCHSLTLNSTNRLASTHPVGCSCLGRLAVGRQCWQRQLLITRLVGIYEY